MKELSIFVDESGDFGEYDEHSSYYIISLVFHDQSKNIQYDLEWIEKHLSELGYSDHCIHTGPIIRNEQEYRKDSLSNRQRLLRTMMTFLRHLDIHCETIWIEKNI